MRASRVKTGARLRVLRVAQGVTGAGHLDLNAIAQRFPNCASTSLPIGVGSASAIGDSQAVAKRATVWWWGAASCEVETRTK
jgi:hypothetical protein